MLNIFMSLLLASSISHSSACEIDLHPALVWGVLYRMFPFVGCRETLSTPQRRFPISLAQFNNCWKVVPFAFYSLPVQDKELIKEHILFVLKIGWNFRCFAYETDLSTQVQSCAVINKHCFGWLQMYSRKLCKLLLMTVLSGRILDASIITYCCDWILTGFIARGKDMNLACIPQHLRDARMLRKDRLRKDNWRSWGTGIWKMKRSFGVSWSSSSGGGTH